MLIQQLTAKAFTHITKILKNIFHFKDTKGLQKYSFLNIGKYQYRGQAELILTLTRSLLNAGVEYSNHVVFIEMFYLKNKTFSQTRERLGQKHPFT